MRQASLKFGGRTIWQKLRLRLMPDECLAVLGPNGAGKSSLLQVLLGLQRLSAGQVEVLGRPPRRGNAAIGFIPQQSLFDSDVPLRGRDLVRLGLDGHRFGWKRGHAAAEIEAAIARANAAAFAGRPLGVLSGGEQQRLRIAQSLVGRPQLLLCDEPFASLDSNAQRTSLELLRAYQKHSAAALVCVTHDINPLLPFTDQVLYIAHGRTVSGPPDEVLTSRVLSQLYGRPVEVLRVHGRIHVITDEAADRRAKEAS